MGQRIYPIHFLGYLLQLLTILKFHASYNHKEIFNNGQRRGRTMTYERSGGSREIQEDEYRVKKSTVYAITAGVIALLAILLTLLWQEYPPPVGTTYTNNPNATTPATTQQQTTSANQ